MSTATAPETPIPATPTCPQWCEAHHVDSETEDHIRLVDAVHRKPHLESIAVELEQAANDRHPLIVLSLFTKTKKPAGMSAGLTTDQARRAYAALGEALRLSAEAL